MFRIEPFLTGLESFPYYQRDPAAYSKFMEDSYYFMIHDYPAPFSYIHISIFKDTAWPNCWLAENETRTITLVGGDTFEERSKLVNETP